MEVEARLGSKVRIGLRDVPIAASDGQRPNLLGFLLLVRGSGLGLGTGWQTHQLPDRPLDTTNNLAVV
jgi:hypothetical protein